jgi:hypothetical protein
MERMIISTAKGYTQQFCVECADNNPELRAHLEKNLDHLEVIELIFGEVCDGCGHPIREVPAYRRLYRLKPELHAVLTAEIPACSALEARLLLHEAIDTKRVLELVQSKIGSDLVASGDLLYDPGSLTYHVAEPQILPPPQDAWVTDLPSTRVPVASPPATLSDLCELAPVQELLARFERSGLSERYTGSFETCLMLHELLAQVSMEHRLMQGYLSYEKAAHPHVWIDLSPSLGQGWLVDYCARSRFGQEAPMGLFTRKDYPPFSYYGAQSPLPLHAPQSLRQNIEEALSELALA